MTPGTQGLEKYILMKIHRKWKVGQTKQYTNDVFLMVPDLKKNLL